MSKYLVKTEVGKQEWQQFNQAGEHVFVSDDAKHQTGPSPVELLCGAVNSCICMSAAMIIKAHKMNVTNFAVENNAETSNLGHGKSIVSKMHLNVSFDSDSDDEERQSFLKHVLHVSTVYQTVAQGMQIEVELG